MKKRKKREKERWKNGRVVVLSNLNIPTTFCLSERLGVIRFSPSRKCNFLDGDKERAATCYFKIATTSSWREQKSSLDRGKLEKIKCHRDPVQIVISKVYSLLEQWSPELAYLCTSARAMADIFTVHSSNCARDHALFVYKNIRYIFSWESKGKKNIVLYRTFNFSALSLDLLILLKIYRSDLLDFLH